MSDEKSTGMSFGDLVGPGSAWMKDRPSREGPEPSIEGMERVIADLAAVHGLDPYEVLAEFRKKSAFNELVRRVLGVSGPRKDPCWEAFEMASQVRGEGLKGQAVFVEAAQRLNAPDATGRPARNISPAAVETYEKEVRSYLRRPSTRLAALFLPEGYRPPRSALKPRRTKG